MSAKSATEKMAANPRAHHSFEIFFSLRLKLRMMASTSCEGRLTDPSWHMCWEIELRRNSLFTRETRWFLSWKFHWVPVFAMVRMLVGFFEKKERRCQGTKSDCVRSA